MTPSLCKLAHVGLVTPDLDKSVWFFRDLLGLEEVDRDATRVYLRCAGELDHHSLVLSAGPVAVDHVSFRTSRREDVAQFERQLAQSGLQVERFAAGDELGQGDAIRFVAPHLEAPLELVYEIEKPQSPVAVRSKLPSNSTRFWRQGVGARRIAHINLSTRAEDIEPTDAWLAAELGFRRRECVRLSSGRLKASWMSVTPQVHDIAVTTDRGNRQGRLHHLAFEMESFSDIARGADMLREHDIHVDVAPGRHGITQGFFFYVRDPGSGHRIELYSGGYLIFDPDWEPIVWDETNIELGMAFFGPAWPDGLDSPVAENTPCFASSDSLDPVAVAQDA